VGKQPGNDDSGRHGIDPSTVNFDSAPFTANRPKPGCAVMFGGRVRCVGCDYSLPASGDSRARAVAGRNEPSRMPLAGCGAAAGTCIGSPRSRQMNESIGIERSGAASGTALPAGRLVPRRQTDRSRLRRCASVNSSEFLSNPDSLAHKGIRRYGTTPTPAGCWSKPPGTTSGPPGSAATPAPAAAPTLASLRRAEEAAGDRQRRRRPRTRRRSLAMLEDTTAV